MNPFPSKALSLAFICALGLSASAARADHVCENVADGIKVQTFTLSDSEDDTAFPRMESPVAVLIKSGQGTELLKELFTGTVLDIPTRVGWAKSFELADDAGDGPSLRIQGTFSFLPCTRAGCPGPLERVTGTLTDSGTSHALVCHASPF